MSLFFLLCRVFLQPLFMNLHEHLLNPLFRQTLNECSSHTAFELCWFLLCIGSAEAGSKLFLLACRCCLRAQIMTWCGLSCSLRWFFTEGCSQIVFLCGLHTASAPAGSLFDIQHFDCLEELRNCENLGALKFQTAKSYCTLHFVP